jgi:hypothetical protein
MESTALAKERKRQAPLGDMSEDVNIKRSKTSIEAEASGTSTPLPSSDLASELGAISMPGLENSDCNSFPGVH